MVSFCHALFFSPRLVPLYIFFEEIWNHRIQIVRLIVVINLLNSCGCLISLFRLTDETEGPTKCRLRETHQHPPSIRAKRKKVATIWLTALDLVWMGMDVSSGQMYGYPHKFPRISSRGLSCVDSVHLRGWIKPVGVPRRTWRQLSRLTA